MLVYYEGYCIEVSEAERLVDWRLVPYYYSKICVADTDFYFWEHQTEGYSLSECLQSAQVACHQITADWEMSPDFLLPAVWDSVEASF